MILLYKERIMYKCIMSFRAMKYAGLDKITWRLSLCVCCV